jgi:hypothetical protein
MCTVQSRVLENKTPSHVALDNIGTSSFSLLWTLWLEQQQTRLSSGMCVRRCMEACLGRGPLLISRAPSVFLLLAMTLYRLVVHMRGCPAGCLYRAKHRHTSTTCKHFWEYSPAVRLSELHRHDEDCDEMLGFRSKNDVGVWPMRLEGGVRR